MSDEETESPFQQLSRGRPRTSTPMKQETPPQVPEHPHTIDHISTNGINGGAYNDRVPEALTMGNPITPDRQAYTAYEAPSTPYQNHYRPPYQSPIQSPIQSPVQIRVQSPPTINREVAHLQQYNPPRVPQDQYSYPPISEPINDVGKQSRRKNINGRNG